MENALSGTSAGGINSCGKLIERHALLYGMQTMTCRACGQKYYTSAFHAYFPHTLSRR